jgi:hypothetical protein
VSSSMRVASLSVVAFFTVLAVSEKILCRDSVSVAFRSGVAYDYFSQKYFIDSLVVSGVDTSLESWEFSRKYLNDSRLWLSADYPVSSDQRNRIHLLGETSNEQWRFRFAPLFSRSLRECRLSGGIELERRDRFKGASESGDSYWFGSARSKLSVPVRGRWRVVTGLTGDAARFDSTTTSALNYHRFGGSAGVELEFGNLSQATLGLFGSNRRVPDSVWLGYKSLGADASLFCGHNRGDVSAMIRAENRVYSGPDGIDDHIRIDANIRSKTTLGSRWFVLTDFDGESVLYQKDNFLNQNVGRIRSSALGGVMLGGALSLAIGPTIELLDEKVGLIQVTPDYTERGLRLDADILAESNLIASLQSVTGERDIYQESNTQSDYHFQRLTVIGDGRLIGRLSFSLFWSIEWEWHDRRSDDAFSHLLSASVSQAF